MNADEVMDQRDQKRELARLREINADMVAAPWAMLGLNNPPVGEPGHIDYHQAVRMAQAALAKAEGRNA